MPGSLPTAVFSTSLPTTQPAPRLVSLDVFRGLTVMAMLLVNNPGDWGHIYAPLAHAEWHGCTPADLIFPFFLFIVGVSIVYALDSARRTQPHGPLLRRIGRRAAVLFGLGLFASLFLYWELATVRIPGVLARIALVFLGCGILFLKTTWRQQLGVLAVLLIGYNLLLQLVPVPGVGAASLGPETNLGAWLDRLLLGEAHLWKISKTWDPEGILGTLPAIGTGLLGLLAGRWLRCSGPDAATKVAWLFVASGAALLLGLIWSSWLPLNKSLWTSSYVLYTGGLAGMGLATLYWLCDVQGYRRGLKPFLAYGVNAITVFFLSSLLARSLNMWQVAGPGGPVSMKDFLYQTLLVPVFPDPYLASLAGGVACVLIWLAVLWIMYERRIIIKV
ncbi:heparan-alpha-glucosaminide N-acetyltransferase domain-containing protein [Hymenobacter sp. BT635]|uniref:Heparan-alpha-glucosaminide N-acetyltransferase domain-containing protein n=1 Tax=Hymenobacter nitidus TaxID=2880929 RepID=A0ABS8AH53_9BACT|nr:heparan-alpha-glucosaminide N-acetyltransferase domain-containing protein [Hymenobacter nitidus]MCB2378324.1 heparan-alpha-glucosaminide N-acetyltransferase domain-containing protein [Hymenobacter nitidus]